MLASVTLFVVLGFSKSKKFADKDSTSYPLTNAFPAPILYVAKLSLGVLLLYVSEFS